MTTENEEPIGHINPHNGQFKFAKPIRFDKVPLTIDVPFIPVYLHQLPQSKPLNDAALYLSSLVYAIDNAFISSWQSTASWQTQLDEAKEYLESHGIKGDE